MIPTVLIFLKAPVPGRAKTRLAAGVGEVAAMEIYGKLVRRQLAAIPTGWPVEVHFTPAEQETLVRAWVGDALGRSFHPQIETELGQRLIHAGQEAIARGAETVFFIGGDCPQLDRVVFQAAADALATGDAVLGPTLDGGYYLLGMSHLKVPLFEGIDWGTAKVADQTRAILRHAGWSWSELPRLRDVDTAADWEALAPLLA